MADDAGQTKIRFDPPTKAELRRISFERDIPVAELVREAVADWLKNAGCEPPGLARLVLPSIPAPVMAEIERELDALGGPHLHHAQLGEMPDPIREPFEETP